eukprot:g9786.t1
MFYNDKYQPHITYSYNAVVIPPSPISMFLDNLCLIRLIALSFASFHRTARARAWPACRPPPSPAPAADMSFGLADMTERSKGSHSPHRRRRSSKHGHSGSGDPPFRSGKPAKHATSDTSVTLSLDETGDESSLARLKEEEIKAQNISSQLMELFEKTLEREMQLAERESVLSKQAGSLLVALQHEEAQANKISETIRNVRTVRKKLLARIQEPKWEVPHHYHMTCCEHILGHTQPHVMDVGEMIPGHLRLFASARRTTLFTKTLIYSLARAKQQRKVASDKIKTVYTDLKETRVELKEVQKSLMELKKKSHLLSKNPSGDQKQPAKSPTSTSKKVKHSFPARRPSAGARGRPGPGSRGSMGGRGPQAGGMDSIRQRYFASLNLRIGRIQAQIEDVMEKEKTSRQAEAKEWTHMTRLLADLEKSLSTKQEVERKLKTYVSRGETGEANPAFATINKIKASDGKPSRPHLPVALPTLKLTSADAEDTYDNLSGPPAAGVPDFAKVLGPDAAGAGATSETAGPTSGLSTALAAVAAKAAAAAETGDRLAGMTQAAQQPRQGEEGEKEKEEEDEEEEYPDSLDLNSMSLTPT